MKNLKVGMFCAVAVVFFANGLFLTEFSLAYAQVAANAPAAPVPSPIMRMLPLFIIITLVYYFMILSPQLKDQKAQKQLLENLKKGDKVVTSSGILGRVAGIEKDYILVEVATNVNVKFDPTHIKKPVETEKK